MTGLIAVDAGQTGIRLRFVDAQQSIEGAEKGIITARPLMPQLARAIIDFTGQHELCPTGVGVGCSGLVVPHADELLTLLDGTGVIKVAIAHNAVTNYLAALGPHPGVLLSGDTGAVVLAVGVAGVARVDGWGYLVGDAGSGHWIGRAGVVAALRAYDGRGQSTVLLDRLRQRFGDPESAYIALQADPDWVGQLTGFAEAVEDAAAAGDVVAGRILDEAAAELSESVVTALRRVGMMHGAPPRVCAAGAVLASPRIRQRFLSYLRLHWPTIELTEPLGDGVEGALQTLSLPSTHPLLPLVSRAHG